MSMCFSSSTLLIVGVALCSAVTVASTTTFEKTEIEHPGLIETRTAISATNADGFRLSLLRSSSGRVSGLFELSREPEFLAEGRGVRLQALGTLARDTIYQAGSITWVEFPLWDGNGDALDADLRDLMEAESVTVVYYLQGGGYKETEFALQGLASAAAEEYGIPEQVSATVRTAARARRHLLEQAAERCSALKRKRQRLCLEAARKCSEDHSESKDSTDTAELEACLARTGSQ